MSVGIGTLRLAGYHRPKTLDEAFALAAEDPEARYVAGGTDLLLRLRAESPTAGRRSLISLRGIAELKGVSGDESVRVGATTPLADLLEAPRIRESFPALAAAAGAIGSPQVRSVATVGGNLANASPCADLAPPLLAAQARLELASSRGRRVVPAGEFFIDRRRTCLERGELLSAILLERRQRSWREVFLRRSRVRMDLAQVSVTVAVELKSGRCADVRVAAGAVAPVPLRLRRTEALLVGKSIGGREIAAAAAAAAQEIAPITDLRASAEHRRRLTAVLVARGLAACLREESP